MNKEILKEQIQLFINENLNSDVGKLSLSKSIFDGVNSSELSIQIISKKKSEKKLPTWFNKQKIYYPASLSIEQSSSEKTAAFKASLLSGNLLIDITAGFGVDDYYFSKQFKKVISCELNSELAEISKYNATILEAKNIEVIETDGLKFIETCDKKIDVIYADPARRSSSGKVFKLADCEPNIPFNLEVLFKKSKCIVLKTSPLLDLTAGLKELKQVSKIYIVSVKNECKELLWVLEPIQKNLEITCVSLNKIQKKFSFNYNSLQNQIEIKPFKETKYLYEPDVAVLKSGAFNLIGMTFNLEKLHTQSHLYLSNFLNEDFPGRIFEINKIFRLSELKKRGSLKGNVIVRNFPDKPELLIKKYKIKPDTDWFLIFTRIESGEYCVFFAKIKQYY